MLVASPVTLLDVYVSMYIFQLFLMCCTCITIIFFQSVVWETPKINQGYLSESTEPGEAGLLRLKTDGVNLQVLWNYPEVFDLTRTYTNNIHAMASTYGIEAACKSIIKVHACIRYGLILWVTACFLLYMV